jgi:hypothetical protein
VRILYPFEYDDDQSITFDVEFTVPNDINIFKPDSADYLRENDIGVVRLCLNDWMRIPKPFRGAFVDLFYAAYSDGDSDFGMAVNEAMIKEAQMQDEIAREVTPIDFATPDMHETTEPDHDFTD